LESFRVEDVEDAVRRGAVDVGFRVRHPGGPGAGADRKPVLDLEVLYREDSPEGLEAVRYLERLREAASFQLLGGLWEARVGRLPHPLRLEPAAVGGGPPRPSAFLTLVPLVLILMTITGAVYPAIDLTAGERERGTLEVLMAAPVPRLGLLLAKYAAVVTVAVLTALVNLGTMALTLFISGLGPKLFGEEGLTAGALAEVFGLLLLLAAFYSGVLLALTSFARSFKEAQAYLVPLMLLSLVPGVVSLMPTVPLAGPLLVVPLLNVVLLARDLLTGSADPLAAVVVVASTLAYALLAVAVAARLFGAEAVLSGRGDGWLRRLRRRRPPG
jgi:ABC-2 type transport system permease protein/sodium transport system permease protein